MSSEIMMKKCFTHTITEKFKDVVYFKSTYDTLFIIIKPKQMHEIYQSSLYLLILHKAVEIGCNREI